MDNNANEIQQDSRGQASDIVWEENGVFAPFGSKNPFSRYVLDKRYITSVSGLISKKTIRIKLFNIAGSEIKQSIFGLLFNYGTITIIARGNYVPNISICVKNPEKVLDIISFAKKEEARIFEKNRNAQKDKKKRVNYRSPGEKVYG